jgi:hypothetical protein
LHVFQGQRLDDRHNGREAGLHVIRLHLGTRHLAVTVRIGPVEIHGNALAAGHGERERGGRRRLGQVRE